MPGTPRGLLPFTQTSNAARRVETENHGLILMEELLASILAKVAYLMIEALVIRLIRAFITIPARPAST